MLYDRPQLPETPAMTAEQAYEAFMVALRARDADAIDARWRTFVAICEADMPQGLRH